MHKESLASLCLNLNLLFLAKNVTLVRRLIVKDYSLAMSVLNDAGDAIIT